MSYKVTVIADFNGNIYTGADKRQLALTNASPIAEVKLYSSQIPFVISARGKDGRVLITTRGRARRNSWTPLRDYLNNDIGIGNRYAIILKEALSRLSFNPAQTIPWSENKALPAGIVLRSSGEYIIVGHDLHGSTSAHFTGGIPWMDAISEMPDLTWAWLFTE